MDPYPHVVDSFAIDLDAFFDGSESLLLIHQRTRQWLTEHKLGLCLPTLGNVPSCIHLLAHHALVMLKVAAKTLGFQSGPDYMSWVRRVVISGESSDTYQRIGACLTSGRTIQGFLQTSWRSEG